MSKHRFAASHLYQLSLILGALFCFVLFQNMSPSDDTFDIREIAPQKPEGYHDFQYLPDHISGNSPNSLGTEILEYHFADSLKALQMRFDSNTGWTNESSDPSGGPMGTSGPANGKTPGSHMGVGILGTDRMGFYYEDAVKFRCDYSASSKSLQISLNRALTKSSNLTLRHETDTQQSTVNFSYRW